MTSSHPVFSDEMKEIVQSFVVETQEIFDELNDDLLRLERAEDTRPIIDEIFRAVHTVKGTSSFLNLEQLTTLTHHFEDVLNRLRRRDVTVHPGMMDVMFAAFDVMNVLLQQVLDGSIETFPMDGLLNDLETLAEEGYSGDGALAGRHLPAPVPLSGKNGPDEPSLSDDPVVTAPPAAAVRTTLAEDAAVRSRTSESVRVSVDRIDDLIGLVGELGLSRDRIMRVVNELAHVEPHLVRPDELSEACELLNSVASELHSAVLQIRMVPVGTVFSRFRRVARDLAKELGKEVEFDVEGEETELDRSLIDEIADPLLHLVRNAIDHGIEAPSERKKHDKPVHGRVLLKAKPHRNAVIVTIEDDGIGIDVTSLRRRAVECGFGTEREIEAMSASDVRNLIFRAGFTAQDKANRISGRGVGLDVVKTSIDRLGGQVRVASEPGRSTCFTVRLPLTAVIQRCLLVDCGPETYALPSASVRKVVVDTGFSTRRDHTVVSLDGEILPLVEMAAPNVGIAGRFPDRHVVVLQVADRLVGLLVDRVRGAQDLVVNAPPSDADKVDGFLGTARVGSGRIVMVLDVDHVIRTELRQRPADDACFGVTP